MTPYNIQEQIVKLKQQGLSSRKIAKELQIGKSTVNDIWNKLKNSVSEDVIKKPKICFIDIESMPSITATFGRRKQNISQDAVLREGGWIASYAYKFLGDTGVKGNVLSEEEAINADDSQLCLELWELIEQSDILVAHNLINFDLPMIKARMIVNGLPPIRKVKLMDTLVLSREFRYNSHKLDSLCQQLGLGEKMTHSGISLWIECMEGNPEALQHLLEYNKQDIVLLEELYLKIAPYSTKHPNIAAYYQGDKLRCNICCSDNVSPTGNVVLTNVNSFEEYVCNACQARFKHPKSLMQKDQRANILRN